ncbi:MAG TPA: endo-1,4-beta-xylanase [Sphingobacteriaceae bacterium]|nr:endo-1,4-beta-xylanase [Sphingobacteriaceae bacterium]
MIGVFVFFMPFFCQAQKAFPLYAAQIPNAHIASDEEFSNSDHTVLFKVSRPELFVYLPSKRKATGTAVIICPGGGYEALVIEREGYDIARRFVKMGVAAFVLKYRLPGGNSTMINKSIGPLQDAQQAIKLVRQRASEWNLDPGKIGIMGFSAGGHLASTAGTHFDQKVIENKEKISLRPDFMILIYPVISMTDSIGHIGSRNNLLGKNPSAQQISYFSNEGKVNKQTPPAFIAQAGDDSVVSVSNSISFYEALRRNKIQAVLHIYAQGGHGFLKVPPRDLWMNELKFWMKSNNWIK